MERTFPCGHPHRTENYFGGRPHYGCRTCGARSRRAAYYRNKGVDQQPLPIAYRTALDGNLREYFAVAGKSVGSRVVNILNKSTPIERAAYMLTRLYGKDVNEVAGWLQRPPLEIENFAREMAHRISLTEHRDKYKDWSLVQELVDSGVPESDMLGLIGITRAAWNRAKREGRVRV